MDLAITIAPQAASFTPPGLDRSAPWLLSSYTEDRWTVCDTHDRSRTKTIDFRYRMPRGRDLTQFPRLYSTVKEYAWWLRDARISRVDDSVVHFTMVRNIMAIAHRLSLDGIPSFSHLQPYDVDLLVEDCRFGLDAVLKASSRLRIHLGLLRAMSATGDDPFASVRGKSLKDSPTLVSRGDVLASCDLPDSAQRVGPLASILDEFADDLGIAKTNRIKLRKAGDIVTVQALQRLIQPLEQLYAMRRLTFAETITYDPFPLGASRIATVKGGETIRTPTPPPKLVLALLESAAKVVADFNPSTSLKSDTDDIAVACWILIAAFSARRYEELASLKADCVHGDDKSSFWLRIYIAKTTKREEFIPIPLLVVRAVRTMASLSEDARTSSGEAKLFLKIGADGEAVPFSFGQKLDRFAEKYGVSRPMAHQDEGGNVWHWHPHQFRRFFAMLYFYRFDGATLESLSHHLRHFSLERTRTYVTGDPEAAAIWMDVEWQHMADVARRISAGESKMAGAMGERLQKTYRRIVDMLRKRVRLQTPERAAATLQLVMQRQGLVLTPKPWVLCSCPRTAKAATQAACRLNSGTTEGVVGPDFASASPTVCSGCPWAVAEQRTLDVLKDQVEELERAAAPLSGLEGVFKAWTEARLVDVRSLVHRLEAKLSD